MVLGASCGRKDASDAVRLDILTLLQTDDREVAILDPRLWEGDWPAPEASTYRVTSAGKLAAMALMVLLG